MEADVDDYSLEQQKTRYRPGSEPVLYRALALFRSMLGWGSHCDPADHAILHPELGWSLMNACGVYQASLARLPSLYLWLYLNGRCGLTVPESIPLLVDDKPLPTPSGSHRNTAKLAKVLPDGQRLMTFLQDYDIDSARALATSAPELVWDTLVAVTKRDPSWHLDQKGGEILIGNDAGRRVWEPLVAAASMLK